MNLVLTAPAPTERSFALPTFSGTPDALAAARAGNVKLLDEMELAWLNAYGPKPTVDQTLLDEECRGENREPLAVDIVRAAGPRGETLVEWAVVTPCPYCWRRPTKRAKCHKCDGQGHTSDAWGSVYADTDANVVEGA